jgi:hypothetical protein
MAQALAAAASDAADTAVASYFEVHVQRDDRWMIDCTAHNADEALAEAEEIARKSDVTAVKVINERYNAATDESAARVVFKVEKRRRSRRSDGPCLVAQPRVARPQPPAGQVPSAPGPQADAPAAAPNAGHARPIRSPSLRPIASANPSVGLTSRPNAAAGPWQLFAWASIALAVAATLLFIVLLLIT